MPSRLDRGRRYGTMYQPARTNTDLLRMPQPRGPVPWTADTDGTSVFWIGQGIEDGVSPIGPHGPWPTEGATMPVVTRCFSLLTDPITTGRFRIRKKSVDNATGALQYDVPTWLTDPQLLRPDARVGASLIPAPIRMPRHVFWRTWVALAIGWGRSYFYCLTGADGAPVAGSLRLINPAMVEVNERGRWQIGDAEFTEDGRFGPGRLVMLANPHTDQGVFLQHPEVFHLSRNIASYASTTYRAGIPAGFLKVSSPNMTKVQADKLKDDWMAAHGGAEASIAVLSATVDFQAVSLSPVDSAFGEVSRLNIAATAYAFNIAPETLGVTLGNSATYSNVSQWFEAHRDFSLSPWIAVVEDTLSALLVKDENVEVNLDAFENPVFSDRMVAYQTAIGAGVLTVDEARAREGLGPLPPAYPRPPFIADPTQTPPEPEGPPNVEPTVPDPGRQPGRPEPDAGGSAV